MMWKKFRAEKFHESNSSISMYFFGKKIEFRLENRTPKATKKINKK